MQAEQQLTDEAFNRLHDVINESRPTTEYVKVRRVDLKALLYDYAAKLRPR